MTRPTFDKIRLAQLPILGERSTCDRGKPACILTKDDRVLSEGYAGSPPGLDHCDDVGHKYEWRTLVKPDEIKSIPFGNSELGLYAYEIEPEDLSQHCIRTVHAEANAIAWAARRGIAVEGATAYVSMTPCRDCAKLLITAGIVRVVVKDDYHASAQSKEMFTLAGVELVIVGEE